MTKKVSVVEQIASCHQQLDEIFLLHQEALIQGQLQDASSILKAYNACHTVHMQFEDEVLLPKYASLEEQGKWGATLYQQEHHKIHNLYEKIEQGLLWLMEQSLNSSQLRRNIINLLDREKSFKGLCEHHQEREESSLLIELDRQVNNEWREEKLNLFLQQWQQTMDKEMEEIKDRI
ncbi:MAG: hypothetical protein HN764_00920 [Gammaproteobacteria bacterium]|jgi:hypothetical protein|nr:hypothetical protein [Gammaproteobacteria bacterium]